jgi:hypothetical protein
MRGDWVNSGTHSPPIFSTRSIAVSMPPLADT